MTSAPGAVAACTGNIYELCGNIGYAIVYSLRSVILTAADVPNPWISPGDTTYTYVGAYNDAAGTGLVSGGTSFTTPIVNIEVCLYLCQRDSNAPYRYVGLENGRLVIHRAHWKIFMLTCEAPAIAAILLLSVALLFSQIRPRTSGVRVMRLKGVVVCLFWRCLKLQRPRLLQEAPVLAR